MGSIISWRIRTENGFNFVFSEIETTTPDIPDFGPDDPMITYNSAWHLTRIYTDNGDEVLFNYTTYTKSSINFNETDYFLSPIANPGCSFEPISPRHSIQQVESTIQGKKLTDISYYENCIQFETNAVVPSEEGFLQRITHKIGSCTASAIREYILVYDGVFLKQFYEKAGLCEQPPYIFDYVNLPFAAPMYYKQDHWGFLNNNSWTAGLVPEMKITTSFGEVLLPGADRGTDPILARNNSLHKITYPTGGSTSFDMEVNDYEINITSDPYFKVEMCDFNDVQVVASIHDTQTGTFDETRTFTLTEKQCVWLKGYFSIERTTPDPAEVNLSGSFGSLSCSAPNPLPLSTGSPTSCHVNVNEVRLLDAGTYSINVLGEEGKTTVSLQIYTKNDIHKQIAGGLRAKTVTHHDGVDATKDKVYKYEYTYTNPTSGTSRSSGNLIMPPTYSYAYNPFQVSGAGTGATFGLYVQCSYYVRTANSLQSLASSNGNIIEYSHVTVHHGLNSENGKEGFIYTSVKDGSDFNDGQDFSYPFCQTTPNASKRGLLKEHSVYRNMGTSFEILTKEINDYVFPLSVDFHFKETIGRRFTYQNKHPATIDNNSYLYESYLYRQQWYYLSKTTTYTYDQSDPSRFIVQYTDFEYDNPIHLKPSRIKKSTSISTNEEITEYRYAGDYHFISSTSTDLMCRAILYMRQNNMNGMPVEEVSFKKKGTNLLLAGGKINMYQKFSNTFGSYFIRPTAILGLPVQGFGTGYAYSTSMMTFLTFTPDPRYETIENFLDYTPKGNLFTYSKAHNYKTGLKWDSSERFILAKVDNASHSEFFYESFETLGTPLSTAKMGEKVFNLATSSYPFTLPFSAGKKYIISVWCKGSGNLSITQGGIASAETSALISASPYEWQLKEFEILTDSYTNFEILSDPTLTIDELRVFPKSAMMSTFNYYNWGGLKSQMDVGGNVKYFEYDSFKRLYLIRDQDQNILQKNQYIYYNSTTPCY